MTSPCIDICTILGGTCQGCGRTLEEIQRWALYTDEEREEIMRRLREQD